MTSEAAAGWLLLAGIAVAYSGLMTRFAGTVYGRLGGASHDEDRIAFVEAHPTKWRLHNGLYAAGAAIAGVGPLWLGNDTMTWAAATAAAAGGFAGAVFAAWRMSVPPNRWWRQPQRGALAFYWTYTVLSMAGFTMLGVWFLDIASWLGIWLIAWNALLLGYILWRRDMPPFAHYVPVIAAGAVLIA